MRVAEFALANEPEEYEFTCTADAACGSANAQVGVGALVGVPLLDFPGQHLALCIVSAFHVLLA